MKKKLFSIIVPVFNNEKNIPETIPYFVDHLYLFKDYDVEIVMVCDGSKDNSFQVMKEMKRRYQDIIKIASFTRNFGQGAAIHCGMDISKGDVIGVISCDMQDPFELFVDMLQAWEEGTKLVVASRKSRNEKGLLTISSKAFHWFVNKFVDDRYLKGGFDFFLVDREIVEPYCNLDMANGALQMALIWLGYKYKNIEYVRKERKKGKSGYKIARKINIALGLFTTYSPILSRVWGCIGFGGLMVGGLSLIILIILGIARVISSQSLIYPTMLIMTSLVLLAIASIGEYIWRTFDNTKNRPRYVIEEKYE